LVFSVRRSPGWKQEDLGQLMQSRTNSCFWCFTARCSLAEALAGRETFNGQATARFWGTAEARVWSGAAAYQASKCSHCCLEFFSAEKRPSDLSWPHPAFGCLKKSI